MKYNTSIIFVIFILVFFGWNCSKKISITNDQESVSVLDGFRFLTEPEVAYHSKDSLYEFYQRIKFNPEQVHHSKFGEIFWNPIAGQFVSGTWFSIFDKELKLVSQNDEIEQSEIFTYQNLPIVVMGTSNQIIFYDLEKQSVLEKYDIKGIPFRYTSLPDNNLKALVTNEFRDTLTIYHFKIDRLISVDTLSIEHNTNLTTLHPNGNILIDGNPIKLNFINTENLNINKELSLTEQCSRIGLSNDGSRLVIISESFRSNVPSIIRILSFPELEEINSFNFGKKLIHSLKNDLLLAGDEEGNVQFVNVKTGETIYSTKEKQQIRCLAVLNDQEILLGTFSFQENETKLIYRNIRTNKDLYTLDTYTDVLLPIVVSTDSKQLYLYYNNTLSQIDLESMDIDKIIETPHMYRASISSDNKYMAFFSRYQQSLLIDLQSKETSELPQTNIQYFFGNNPNEALLLSSDFLKVYQIDTKEWIYQEELEDIKLNWLPLTKNVFPNPLNPEEVIFADHSSRAQDLIHFNKTTYNYYQPFSSESNSRLRRIRLIGLNKKGDYYLSCEWNKTYICDAETFQIIDSLPIPFDNYNNRLAATAQRNAFYTRQSHSTLVFDPTNPSIRQQISAATYFLFSPDLTYLIQTRRNVLDIYKWKGD
jgi:hypothetical protein